MIAMAAFVAVMAAAALAFWCAALVLPGGVRGAIGAMGPGATSLFGALHLPAAIAGLLLWQWRRRRLRPLPRVALEAATIYFWAAVAMGLVFNAIAAGLLGAIS